MRLHLLVDDGGVIGERGTVVGVLPEIGVFLHMNVMPHLLERFVCLVQGSHLLVQIVQVVAKPF